MFQLHEQIHAQYGMCLWTILAFAVFAIMIVMTVIHLVRQNRRNEKFDKKMSETYEFDDHQNKDDQ